MDALDIGFKEIKKTLDKFKKEIKNIIYFIENSVMEVSDNESLVTAYESSLNLETNVEEMIELINAMKENYKIRNDLTENLIKLLKISEKNFRFINEFSKTNLELIDSFISSFSNFFNDETEKSETEDEIDLDEILYL